MERIHALLPPRTKIPIDIEILGDYLSLRFPYHKGLVEEIKAMDKGSKGGWDDKDRRWVILNNKRNIFAFSYLLRKDPFMWYRKPVVDLKADYAFWKHQHDIYNFIMARRRCIIAGEMRTGKTWPTLMAIQNSKWPSAWVVSTTPALRGLKRELIKWGFTKDAHLMTYNKFTTLANQIKDGADIDIPPFIVFDEMQKLKTPTSGRGEAARELVDLMDDKYGMECYVVGLSGTPSPKDPSDWWNLCEVAQPGFIRESNKSALYHRLGNLTQQEGALGNKYWSLEKTEECPKGWKEDEVSFLYERLKGLVLVVLKREALPDLPEKVYEVRSIKPSKKILLIAKTIADNADNKLVARNLLRQLSDGFQYTKDYDAETGKVIRGETKFVGSPKLSELKLDLEEHEDIGRIIIYGGFKETVDRITDVCLESGWVVCRVDGRGWHVFKPKGVGGDITPEHIQEEMDRSTNQYDIPKIAFVAQSDSAGTGLELSAAPTVIYVSNSDSGDARMQSEDRAHSNNMDKVRGLTIIDYCYLPVDYLIRDNLLAKKHLQSLSLGDIKDSIDKALREEEDI